MKNLSRQLFRIKDLTTILAESHDPNRRLKKALGAFDVTLLGIGVIIGAGIFAAIGTGVTGTADRPGAGPGLIVSFALTAIACGFAALCYAELASLVPISGSAYTYSYSSFGEIIAWIIGWDLICEYTVGSIAVSIGWSGYFLDVLRGLRINMPAWLTVDYRTAMRGFKEASQAMAAGTPFEKLDVHLQNAWTAVHTAPPVLGMPIMCNISASIIILLLTVILVIGIKASSRFNYVIVGIKLLALALFVAVGIKYIKPANWTPFAPNGFAGIRAGAATIFFAYIGFDAVSTVAEETKNPKRDMPIGIIGSLVICTIIYMVVSVVFTGLVPFDVLKNELSSQKAESLAVALRYVGADRVAGMVSMLSVIALTTVLLVLMLGQARIFFSMSRDGLLPRVFSRVHHRFKTPYINTILIGLVVAFFASFATIDEMMDLTNIGTLFAFVLVCFGVIILRIKEPHRHRPFKVPGSPLVPLLGVLACVFVMSGLTPVTWIRFFVWLVIGFLVYFGYSYKHSLLHKRVRHMHEAMAKSK
jgi:APA family basic amino acid/polyamine antiporter